VKAYFDTTVLLASCVESHPHLSRADTVVDSVKQKQFYGYVSAHGLAEFYAVSTRTPFTPPILPHEAWLLLAEEILPHFEVISRTGEDYRETICRMSEKGWSGGRIYDLLHIASAQKANCDRIYAFEVRDFHRLASEFADRIVAP
jgi:predicted nucleic acid-binding protein